MSMEASKQKYTHVWISIAFYIICLAFPGYYIRPFHDPQLAFGLLLWGWLGVLDGHFSWFANPIYYIALLTYKKTNLSSLLGFIALIFALSFLGYKNIAVSEAPTYANITAYGWGYFFWVISIGILSIGQLIVSMINESQSKIFRQQFILQSLFCVISLILFASVYFIGDKSHYSIVKNRNLVFLEKCKLSGQKIYKEAGEVKGIYFASDWGIHIGKIKNGDWISTGGGVLSLGYLNSGFIQFYETNNERPSQPFYKELRPYKRHYYGDHKGIEVNNLLSEYAIETTPLVIPREIGIYGATVIIKDVINNTVIAETTYVLNKVDHMFCGYAPTGYFSTTKFVQNILNLTIKYKNN